MPQIYLPHSQAPFLRMALQVRTATDPTSIVSAIRKEVHAMNPELPVYGIKTMDDLLVESVAPRRFALVLIGLFAALALLVASIGIYGVISYSVTERTREFGLRMALGAMQGDVLRSVLGRGLRMVAIGIVVGVAGALAVTRLLASYLFGVSGHDPITFVAVAGISVDGRGRCVPGACSAGDAGGSDGRAALRIALLFFGRLSRQRLRRRALHRR